MAVSSAASKSCLRPSTISLGGVAPFGLSGVKGLPTKSGAKENWSSLAPAWLSSAALGRPGRSRDHLAAGLYDCDQCIYRGVQSFRTRGLLPPQRLSVATKTPETERSHLPRTVKL